MTPLNQSNEKISANHMFWTYALLTVKLSPPLQDVVKASIMCCVVPTAKNKSVATKSFSYNTIKIWNSLDNSIKSKSVYNSFKQSLKHHLVHTGTNALWYSGTYLRSVYSSQYLNVSSVIFIFMPTHKLCLWVAVVILCFIGPHWK